MNERMYRVNDIFYTLQGEGHNTGRAAVFVRFAGCNLRCPFCDTEFDTFQPMNASQILQAIAPYPARFIVLTGGEPTLQVDEAFVDLLHQHGYEVAMESNGLRPAPQNIDWLTVSPKKSGEESVERGEWRVEGGERMPDELKLVFDEHTDPEAFLKNLKPQTSNLKPLLYLQPCDMGDAQRNAAIMERCIDYIKHHPQWRLSLQTHKLIGIE